VVNLADYARDAIPVLRRRHRGFWTDLHDWDGVEEFHRGFTDASVVQLSGDRLPEPEALCRELARSAKLVVCTLGAAGALAVTGRDVLRIPSYAVDEVVDSNGAGDAFTAGLMHARAAGWPLADCVRAGCLAGAITVSSPDLVSPELTAAALERARSGPEPPL
jgi:sugar/nucleoside kinase (ribokinase family)